MPQNGQRAGFNIGGGLNLTPEQRFLLRDTATRSPEKLAQLFAERKGLQQRLAQLSETKRNQLAGALSTETGHAIDPFALPTPTGNQGFGVPGMGFTDVQRGRLRQAAASGGNFDALLANSPGLAGRIRQMTPEQQVQLAGLLGVDPKKFQATPPVPGTPDAGFTTGPPAIPANTPAPRNAYSGMTPAGLIASDKYTAPQDAGGRALNTYYTQGLSRLNALPQQSFEDMFGKYLDVANREADRNAASITESFGSRGGRYSSDLLNAQTKARGEFQQQNANQAGQFLQQLNTQRQQEGNMLGQIGGQQQQQRGQDLERAQKLFTLDYLKRTGAPDLLGAATQYAQGFGSPDTVVY